MCFTLRLHTSAAPPQGGLTQALGRSDVLGGCVKIGERTFVGVFGFFLLCVGIYAVLLGEVSPAWRYLGGGVLCALGANAVYGAITGKRPWISKIGPLP